MSKTTTKPTTSTKAPRVFIHPYKGGSRSAKALAEALGARRILINGKSRYKSRKSDIVINWGSSKRFIDDPIEMLNQPSEVSIASNKLTFFNTVSTSNVSLVPFTESVETVNEWLDDGNIVCARTKLTGHSAEGLVLIGPRDSEKELDIPAAKLYTKYVPKALEYRVHVFNGEVIRVQKKILRPELSERIKDSSDDFSTTDVDWKVRNHDNGFVYVTTDVEKEMPPTVKTQAIRCVRACGLVFGAVDVIYNAKKKAAFVLEVNTSPGLEGETITAYVDAIKTFVESGGELVNKLSDNPYEGFDFSGCVSKARAEIRGRAIVQGKLQYNVDSLGTWTVMRTRLNQQGYDQTYLASTDKGFGIANNGGDEKANKEIKLFCEALLNFYNISY